MKIIFALVFTASAALNATFVFLAIRSSGETSAPPPVAQSAVDVETPRPPALTPHVWASFETGNLAALSDQLRASGFPPEITRAILRAQISDLFAERRRALMNATPSAPYWKDQLNDAKRQLALRQLGLEEQRHVRDVLGADADQDDPIARLQRQNLDYLPTEKASEARRVLREFEERRAELFAMGINFTIDQPKLTALDKEQHAAIAQMLTAEELLEYNLRTSQTANLLRNELSVFEPSEEEFRRIYQLRAPFDERFPRNGTITMNADERRQYQDAQKLLTEQIKAALAPDRAAQYERATDYNYRRTSQLIARLELPRETTEQLWAVKTEFEQRRRDPSMRQLSAQQRTEMLNTLHQEAVARVTPMLGSERGVEAYKQYGGTWLRSLQPPPRP